MDRIIRIKLDSRQAEQGIDRVDDKMVGLGRTSDGLQTKISGIAAAISAVLGGVALQRLAQLSDSWTRFGNSVRQAADTVEQFNAIQEALYRIAQDGRVEVEGVADAFVRIDRSVAQFGFSQRDTIQVVEGLTKAFAASGATAQEVSSVLVQLGQGLGVGALQGDELRAVLEASQPVAAAIAKEFGVTTGQLKKLGEQGKLTSDRVFVALQKALPEFQQAFDKAVPTIAQGATVAGNAITKFVGEFEKLTGIGAAVSQSLIDLAGGFDLLTDAVAGGQLSAVTSSYSRQIGQVRQEFVNLIDVVSSIPSELSESLATTDNDFVRISRRIVSVIGQTLDSVLFDIDLTFDATANYGGSTAKLLQEAFLNIIPNIRAAVQVATVEITALLDAVAAQSTLGVKAIFSDEAKKALDDRLSAIESAKQTTVNAILAERQADSDATKAAIQNSKDRTAQLKLERDQRAGNVGVDPLGTARSKTSFGPSEEDIKRIDLAEKELYEFFDALTQFEESGQSDESAARINERIAALRLETQTMSSELVLQQGVRQGFISQEQAALDLQTASKIQRAISERELLLAEKSITDEQTAAAELAFNENILAITSSYEDQKTEIARQQAITRMQIESDTQQTYLETTQIALGALTNLIGGSSAAVKAMKLIQAGANAFQIYAASETAAALILATPPGPVLNPSLIGLANAVRIKGKISAGAVLAAGAASTFGGGGSSGSFSGGGGGSSGSSSLPTNPQSAPNVQTLEIRGLDEIRDELRNQDGMVSTRFVATILDKISDANRIRGEG